MKLYLLGSPYLEKNDRVLEFDTRKALALLAYLAVNGHSLNRDTFTGLFWPEYSQSRARANLRRVLSTLAKGMGKACLELEGDSVSLNPNGELWVDVQEFARLVAQTSQHFHAPEVACTECLDKLSRAIVLYRGDFMAGFSLRDSPDFEAWQCFQNESLRREAMAVLRRLVLGYMAGADYEPAIAACRHWVALDPLDEVAQRQLMQLYAWSGQRNTALRQYKTLVKLLQQELDTPPDAETVALEQAIQANRLPAPPIPTRVDEVEPGLVVETSAESQIPRSSALLPEAKPKTNLPAQTTLFVGRQTELAELANLMAEPTCRLMTLVGLGGIGKTRLALEFAATRLAEFPDGVWLVPLAAATTPEAVEFMLIDTLAVRLGGPATLRQQLLDFLQTKAMLIILDNLEHLLSAENPLVAHLVDDILRTAPGVKLLVTSRERLDLQGEWLIGLDGLPVPPPIPSQERPVEAYAALQLFQYHVRRHQPGRVLSTEEIVAATEICRMVYGLPLGIELAAAWTRFLSCQEIAQEIARNIDFLAVTTRNVPERQRSLRAAFEYSWRMLTAQERAILARLAIFKGGFLRSAAAVIAGAALPVLVSLVNKSLLQVTPAGRYEMHELLRQYATEKLWLDQPAGSADHPQPPDAIWQRYAAYYIDFVRRREPLLRGATQQAALAELRAELDNLRHAWSWLVSEAQFDTLQAGLPGLVHFYDLANLFQEGEAVFQKAVTGLQAWLATTDQASIGVRLLLAELNLAQAQMLTRLGQIKQAIQLTQTALEQALSSRDTATEIRARRQLGETLNFHGRYSEGRLELEQALNLAQTTATEAFLLEIRRDLGISAVGCGEYARAKELLEQVLIEFNASGDYRNQGLVLLNLGVATHGLQDYQDACRYTEAAGATFQKMDDHFGWLTAQNNLGFIEYELGYYSQAQARLQTMQHSPAWQEYHIGLHFWHTLGNLSRDMGDFTQAVQAYQRCLELGGKAGDGLPQVLALADLALLSLYQGQLQCALDQATQSAQLAVEMGLPAEEALALTHQGQALAALNQPEKARLAYQRAFELRQSLGQTRLAVTPQAGLAQLCLDADDIGQAAHYAGQILPHLETGDLVGIDQPWWVFLVCCRVLEAKNDAIARELLTDAYCLLLERAHHITDPVLRDAFLTRIPPHRSLVTMHQLLIDAAESKQH